MSADAARRRRGRPPGHSDTRERILTNARDLFANRGFAGTSVRAIAAAAGVDSALVHHYFGTKQQLFAAAIDAPVDPMTILIPLRELPLDELGHRLPAILLTLWDSAAGAGLLATLRTLLTGGDVPLARSFFRDIVVAELSARADDPPGSGVVRAEFVASQLMGIVVARYIVGLEPMASLPADAVVAMIGPTLQRYLSGELPDPLRP
ncbi:TetR/AcrR family transcriptional regulator [Mycobacterium koreense]|uniref:TetR family transcriptional regulator n=1 Tax=Mycolicibacillus koreensis TaxID=1069220 RepID=A0A7I7SAX7_9MYCO|nr:TetR family transcriptional regulator [Mycolicibacillus koreensis]MCV7248776.1 TetR/AcrR family transcriptional regulator [Mycolicibacillus koreensis]ODR08339.1 TetR family transcriptional regulator [Mycolicibacillus koreensis]OSC36098.1 TetR family transcriptional regulator [Mycolicibacillus koreensis]BBY53620.1 TetR family transcriptional regulator [Mycolicibacillus koreensis]